MALNINANQYNGGAQILNTQPAVSYYLQQLQRREARNAALDDYYNNIQKSINPAGMRTQDLEGGFNPKVNAWKDFYHQNKAAIRDPSLDNGRALNQFNSQFTDLNTDILKSKDAANKEVMLAKQKLTGDWEPSDDDLATAHRMSASIYDPIHYKDGKNTPYDMMDFSFSHPQFGPKEQDAYLKSILGGMKPHDMQGDIRIDKVAGTKTIPYTQMYADDQIRSAAELARIAYQGSKGARHFFQKEVHNEDTANELTDAFKSVYGRAPQNDTEDNMAWVILNAKKPQGTTEKVLQYVDPNKWREQYAQKKKDSADLKRLAKSLGIKDEEVAYEDPIEPTMQRWETNARNHKPLAYKFGNGQELDTYSVAAPAALKKLFTIREGAHVIEPDEIKITGDNGDYMGIFYQKKDGKVIKDNGVSAVSTTRPPVRLSREDVKSGMGNMLLTKKENQKILQNQNKPKKVTLGHGSLDND